MIVKRIWRQTRKSKSDEPMKYTIILREGWFLFGIVPLYIKTIDIKYSWTKS